MLSIGSSRELGGKSLWMFGEESKLRQSIMTVVSSKKFEYFIMIFIVLSSVQLALENPLNDPDGVLVTVLYYADICFTSIFFVEAILKIVASGLLLNGPRSYLKNYWNMIDFTIVVFSVCTYSLFYRF